MDGSRTLSLLGVLPRQRPNGVGPRALKVPILGVSHRPSPSPSVPRRLVVPTVLLLLFGGLGLTALQAEHSVPGGQYLHLAPVLSGATVCLSLVASWVALVTWQGSADILSGRLALAIPCLVWASQGVVGAPILANQSTYSHGTPSTARIVIGVFGTALIVAHVVSRERVMTESLILRMLLGAVGLGAASLLSAIAFRHDPLLHLAIRDRVADIAFPAVWVLLAGFLTLKDGSNHRRLRGTLSAFLILLAVGQLVNPAHLHGALEGRAPLGAASGLMAVAIVLIGLGCELRASYDARQSQVVALEFERALTASQLTGDRLARSRRAHDQRAALLSVEAVIRLLEVDSPAVDAEARQRLSAAAAKELQRLRSSYDEASLSVSSDADLHELLEPVVAVARAEGANVEMHIRAGLAVHVSTTAMIDITRNLISNAVHHGANKAITVSARRAEYDFIELSVTDSGSGIAFARRFDLFEPGRGSGGPGRCGLGLYSARSMLREMGGDLIVDRTYTGGARFVACIPIATNTEPQAWSE